MSEYDEWLKQQRKAANELSQLIKSCKLDAIVVAPPKKPPHVKLLLPDKRVELFIKTVQSKFAKSIWLCKESELSEKKQYLLYIKHDNTFLIASGEEIDKECELKSSDWKQDKMVVVDKELFHDAKVYFELVHEKYERKKQSRLTSW